LLVTTLKIIQLLGLSPTGAPPLDPAGGLPSPDPLWFCPHPKPPSAAFELDLILTSAIMQPYNLNDKTNHTQYCMIFPMKVLSMLTSEL